MMDDGWPLGLQLMNARNLDLELTGSSSVLSFSTLFTSTAPASSSSSSFSSEKCTKTPYFYQRRRRGVTLQSLLNTPSTLHISITTTSTSSPPPQQRHLAIGELKKSHVTHKPKSWLHSLCSKPASHDTDYRDHNETTTTTTKSSSQLSLGYLLEQERVMRIRRGLER